MGVRGFDQKVQTLDKGAFRIESRLESRGCVFSSKVVCSQARVCMCDLTLIPDLLI